MSIAEQTEDRFMTGWVLVFETPKGRINSRLNGSVMERFSDGSAVNLWVVKGRVVDVEVVR